jgi:hypothetical protein
MRLMTLGLISLLASMTVASPSNGAGARVSFSGCPTPGVEAGCVLVRSHGKTYNVSSAHPPVTINGLGVSGSGIPEGVSSCLQGVVLQKVSWRHTRQRCPLPPVKP